MTHTGGCLCGAVRFEVDGDIPFAENCHCSRCRRSSGTAFLSVAQVLTANVTITQGRDNIASYATEGLATRAFCRTCGSTLFGTNESNADVTGIPMGLFDGDPGVAPSINGHVGSKANWYTITDDLPQME